MGECEIHSLRGHLEISKNGDIAVVWLSSHTSLSVSLASEELVQDRERWGLVRRGSGTRKTARGKGRKGAGYILGYNISFPPSVVHFH